MKPIGKAIEELRAKGNLPEEIFDTKGDAMLGIPPGPMVWIENQKAFRREYQGKVWYIWPYAVRALWKKVFFPLN